MSERLRRNRGSKKGRKQAGLTRYCWRRCSQRLKTHELEVEEKIGEDRVDNAAKEKIVVERDKRNGNERRGEKQTK